MGLRLTLRILVLCLALESCVPNTNGGLIFTLGEQIEAATSFVFGKLNEGLD